MYVVSTCEGYLDLCHSVSAVHGEDGWERVCCSNEHQRCETLQHLPAQRYRLEMIYWHTSIKEDRFICNFDVMIKDKVILLVIHLTLTLLFVYNNIQISINGTQISVTWWVSVLCVLRTDRCRFRCWYRCLESKGDPKCFCKDSQPGNNTSVFIIHN